MSNSNLLVIPEVGDSQNNKATTINNMLAYLEQATQRTYTNLSVGGSNVTISEADFTRYFMFAFDGLTGNRTVSFPATVDGNTTQRIFAVSNRDTVDTLTVQSTGTPGQTVSMGPGTRGLIQQVGTDCYLVADRTPTLATTYPADIGVFLNGKPADGDVVAIILIPRACTMADNFAGSYGYVGVNPTSSASFNVARNASNIGTISISTGGVFTFTTTGSGTESFAAGDRLVITAPSPQDATLEDIAITFAATRTG